MKQKTYTKKDRLSAKVFTLGAMGVLAVFCIGSSMYTAVRASVSNTLCVAVRVVGPDGGDPGQPYCDPNPVPALSSSSSSLSSSSYSSTPVSGSSVSDGDRGGRRYSIEQSRYRIIQLLQYRSLRLRPAAGCTEPYADVSDNDWYKIPVNDFYCEDILDDAQYFRPFDSALRAEIAALLVRVKQPSLYKEEVEHFADAPFARWFFISVETAAKQGWMRGYGDCYGSPPCYARPAANVTRAEAAALIIRTFNIPVLSTSSSFEDVSESAWYSSVIATAHSTCVMKGDADTGQMRPEDPVTRAEMVTMIWRARSFDACNPLYALEGPMHMAAPNGVSKESVPSYKDVLKTSIDGGVQSSYSAPLCADTSTVACIMSVLAQDALLFMSPLAGMLLWPTLDVLRTSPPMEVFSWSVLLLIITLFVLSVQHIYLKRSRNF